MYLAVWKRVDGVHCRRDRRIDSVDAVYLGCGYGKSTVYPVLNFDVVHFDLPSTNTAD